MRSPPRTAREIAEHFVDNKHPHDPNCIEDLELAICQYLDARLIAERRACVSILEKEAALRPDPNQERLLLEMAADIKARGGI